MRSLVHNILYNKKLFALVSGAAIVASIGLGLYSYDRLPTEFMRVDFIDVGQGDGMLITMPDRTQVVVDTGRSAAFASALGRYMPLFDKSLDMVVITHNDADHIGGFDEVLRHYEVESVLFNGVFANTQEMRSSVNELRTDSPQIIQAKTGQRFEFADNIVLEVLSPDIITHDTTHNDASIVLRLDHGDVSLLLTGDIEKAQEHALVAGESDLDVDILKVAHHGSRTSTSQEFLEQASPGIAIIQVGEANTFGHPTTEVLDRLSHAQVYRTDHHGTISILSDGTNIRVLQVRE